MGGQCLVMSGNGDRGEVLVVLGHGSSKHPGSSASVRRHAQLLLASGKFDEVRVAFLKEEPLVDTCLDGLEGKRVLVVPDFLAEGYFTRLVIPRKLSVFSGWKDVCYCPPVGTHPLMVEMIESSAEGVLGSWLAAETSLLVVGHGSGKNPCSKQTLQSHLELIRQRGAWGQVADLWLEEPPRVSEWSGLAECEQVVVVPFLLNDGQHGGWDIPADLGIGDDGLVRGVTHEVAGRRLKLTSALGTSERFAEAMAELARIWGRV